MSDAPSLPEGGDETGDRPRPEAQSPVDAPEIAAEIAAGQFPPPDAVPEEPAAAALPAREREEGPNAAASDPRDATPGADAAPAQANDSAAALLLPMMLPPFLDAPGGELSAGDYGPAEEDPSPLRFLREPVQYVGAPNGGPPAEEIAPPAVALPALDEPAPAHDAPAGMDASTILDAISPAERHAQAEETPPPGVPAGVRIRVPHSPPADEAALPEPAQPEVAGPPGGATSDSGHFPDQGLRFTPPMADLPPPMPDLEPPSAWAEAAAHPAVSVVHPADDDADLYAEPVTAAAPPTPLVERTARAAAEAEDQEALRPADPVREAAARIAAEATATAHALESLKRLLEHKLPDPGVVAPPRQVERPPLHADRPRFQAPPTHERVAPPPATAGHPMRMTAGLPPYIAPPAPPLPIPLMQPEPRSAGRIYLLGFLAGFGLALAAGAMLYLFISIG
jgi:hypothetical protein